MSPPKTLSEDQVDKLIAELYVKHGTRKQVLKGLRNMSMAVVMLETGLRVGELCRLLISDLWFAGQPVTNLIVRKHVAKNHKERQIPISVRLCDAILELHSNIWCGVLNDPGCYCFYSSNPLKPLTTRSVERFILDAGKNSCNVGFTPHMLRHTFATRVCRKSNTKVTQELLGHDSLTSTQIYLHPNLDDLTNAIRS